MVETDMTDRSSVDSFEIEAGGTMNGGGGGGGGRGGEAFRNEPQQPHHSSGGGGGGSPGRRQHNNSSAVIASKVESLRHRQEYKRMSPEQRKSAQLEKKIDSLGKVLGTMEEGLQQQQQQHRSSSVTSGASTEPEHAGWQHGSHDGGSHHRRHPLGTVDERHGDDNSGREALQNFRDESRRASAAKRQQSGTRFGGGGGQGRRLSHLADPFAVRAGKKLTWTDVNMTVTRKKRCLNRGDGGGDNGNGGNGVGGDEEGFEEETKQLLADVWGEVPEREVTAIMGPSGAGKTSLLNILAGRAKTRGPLTISADVRLNNYRVDPTDVAVRKQIAFVAQDDSLQVSSTPREAIRFSAKMRLPRATTEDELDVLVDHVLEELGLTHCAETVVGGALIKGISGGERKRTSVGVELVVKPALVFLDEPTSGLDSFSAVQLIEVLKKVANAGSSVLFTIHQPSSDVFNSFDRVILLNRGRVMYQGEVTDVPSFFAERGFPVPRNYNPADWIMNVAQVVPERDLNASGFYPPNEIERTKPPSVSEEGNGRDALGITLREGGGDGNGGGGGKKKPQDDRHVSFCTEVSMQFRREMKNLARNKKPLVARYAFSMFMSVLIGVIFLDAGRRDPTDFMNFQAHFGALIMILMLSMFSTAMPSLLAFPEERPVFLREYSTNHYSVVSYFISRLATEFFVTFPQMLLAIVIQYNLVGIQMNFGYLYGLLLTLAMGSTALATMLGCSVEDPKMATEFLPILFVPQMLLAGFFVSPHLIPSWLRWAQYLCSLTYAVRLGLAAEFGDCARDNVPSCRGVLTSVQVYELEEWVYWLILVSLFVIFRLSALIILRKKATKFF